MNKINVFALATIAALSAVSQSKATVLYSDNFNSYVNGNLAGTSGANAVGQGNWAQTGASAATPVQVNNGAAVLGTSGQDIYSPLSSIYTIADGTSLYFGLTINVSSAQSTGDYFFHFAPTSVSDTLFFGRTFIKSTTGGFLLGYLETSGTGGTVNYGSTVLSFGTSYNIVVAYNAVAGTLNDTATLYVNPTDAVEANNGVYLTDAWTTTVAENHNVGQVNLRQGTAANAPGLSVDNIVVGTAFTDVIPAAPVPEPGTMALAAIGGLAGLWTLRRKH